MKKNLLALVMGTMLVAALVVGCGEKADTASNNAASDNAVSADAASDNAVSENVAE